MGAADMGELGALTDYPERRAALRPGAFDRRAVSRAVARIPVIPGPDAWAHVLERATATVNAPEGGAP